MRRTTNTKGTGTDAQSRSIRRSRISCPETLPAGECATCQPMAGTEQLESQQQDGNAGQDWYCKADRPHNETSVCDDLPQHGCCGREHNGGRHLLNGRRLVENGSIDSSSPFDPEKR